MGKVFELTLTYIVLFVLSPWITFGQRPQVDHNLYRTVTMGKVAIASTASKDAVKRLIYDLDRAQNVLSEARTKINRGGDTPSASRLPPLDRLCLLRYFCPPAPPVSEENRVVWTLFVPYPDGSEQIMEKFRLNQYFSFQNDRDDNQHRVGNGQICAIEKDMGNSK